MNSRKGISGRTSHGLHQMLSTEWSQKYCSSKFHRSLMNGSEQKFARINAPSPRIRNVKVSSTTCSATQLRSATAAVSQLSPEPLGERKRPFSRSHFTDQE